MRGAMRAVRGLRGRGTKLSLVLSMCTCAALLGLTATAGARVFHVGTFEGKKGKSSLQKAVEAAAPGDWILVAPGDYKETGDHLSAGASAGEAGSGVLVEKAGIHIRGMDRNGVIIDGTKKHTPTCSNNPADQELGSGSTSATAPENRWPAPGAAHSSRRPTSSTNKARLTSAPTGCSSPTRADQAYTPRRTPTTWPTPTTTSARVATATRSLTTPMRKAARSGTRARTRAGT